MAPEVTKRFIEGVKKNNWPEEQKILIGVALLEGSSLREREVYAPISMYDCFYVQVNLNCSNSNDDVRMCEEYFIINSYRRLFYIILYGSPPCAVERFSTAHKRSYSTASRDRPPKKQKTKKEALVV